MDAAKVLRSLFGVVGVLVVLFGALFLSVAVGQLFSGEAANDLSVHIGLLVFFVGVIGAGGWLAWSCLGRRPSVSPTMKAEAEHRVLGLARRRGGRLTVAEVAVDCKISVDDAKIALDELVLDGVAELHISDDGVLVYEFPGFLSDQEKRRATR